MSREDRLRRIFGQPAPEQPPAPEPVPARPENVVALPVRSKFLDKTAPVEIPEGARVFGPWAGWLAVVGPYLSVALLTLTLLVAGVNANNYLTRRAILVDIGETTCSPENSIMWIEGDPGSNVPRLKEEVLARCAQANRLR